MSAFVDSTLASALQRLDRACDAEEKDVRRIREWALLAREHLLALQELLEVERDMADNEVRKAAGKPVLSLVTGKPVLSVVR